MVHEDTYDSFLKKAIGWLLQSDIRNKSSDRVAYSGFNLGYDLRKKSFFLAYCEITGYAVSLLLYLHQLEKNFEFLQLAQSSGKFLVDTQYKGARQEIFGAFPKGYSFSQKAMINEFYSFDAAVCISALVDLFEETNEQSFLESAKIAGNWLVDQMQFDDGAFRAMYNYGRQDFAQTKKWFENKGCLHAKNAIGLLKLYGATGNIRFKESAKKVCDWVLSLQKTNGAFAATEDESYTFTHAHCYATEGLLYGYFSLNNQKYLDAVQQSGKWLIKAQNADGSLYRHYDKRVFIPTKTTDATAQASRIWVILYQLTSEKEYLDAAQKGAKFLLSMQCQEKNDRNSFGGVFLQSQGLWKLRYIYPIVSTWPLVFAVKALYALENMKNCCEMRTMLD
jgi:uncharacterized protein YyaL (SSP411 family)